MSWLVSFASSVWAKLAIGAAIVAAIGIFLWRVYAAGRDAERLRRAKADLDYTLKTAKETNDADQNLADPRGTRGRRVRERFQRD